MNQQNGTLFWGEEPLLERNENYPLRNLALKDMQIKKKKKKKEIYREY